eukprot:2500531-Prymnesium_polylepis.1
MPGARGARGRRDILRTAACACAADNGGDKHARCVCTRPRVAPPCGRWPMVAPGGGVCCASPTRAPSVCLVPSA